MRATTVSTEGRARSGARQRGRENRRPLSHGAKGQQTASRILDAAEALFAERGYEGTSLRQIAHRAGIAQPGLYNYFANKQALYVAVLDRALLPMTQAMAESAQEARRTGLASVMTDILLTHPRMSALFHRALQGDARSVGNRLILDWLERLFRQALAGLGEDDAEGEQRIDLVLETIAMFNVTTGYFLAQPLYETLVGGSLSDPEVVERQKRLLERIQRAARAPRS